MGVGGDDSWGAPVHDEHLIPANQDMEFEFVINRI
jgi:beta-galactosidase